MDQAAVEGGRGRDNGGALDKYVKAVQLGSEVAMH